MRARFIPRKRCMCSHLKSLRRALLQDPGRHLRGGYNNPSLVVATPPCIVVVEARIGRKNALPAIMPGRTQRRSLFGPPRHTGKARGAFPEPPHAVVRAPRADGTVHTTALCLARLEGTGIAEREVRVPTFRAIGPRRAGLDVVVYRYVVAPRQVVVVVLEQA